MVSRVSHAGAEDQRPESKRAHRLTGGDFGLVNGASGAADFSAVSGVVSRRRRAEVPCSRAIGEWSGRAVSRSREMLSRLRRRPNANPRLCTIKLSTGASKHATEAVSGAVDRHGAGAQANEPGVGESHRRVHEAAGVGERDQAGINQHETRRSYRPGRARDSRRPSSETAASITGRGPIAVKQVADDRSFDRAFGAGEGKRERSRGAAEIEFLAERQEENSEAVAVQACA